MVAFHWVEAYCKTSIARQKNMMQVMFVYLSDTVSRRGTHDISKGLPEYLEEEEDEDISMVEEPELFMP